MRFRVWISILSVVASALILAASAQAATDLGQLGTNHNCGGADYTEIQTATGSPPRYDVPMDGVINSWSVQATTATNVVVRLKMFRPTASANQFMLIGESSNQGPLTPNAVNGPFPTSIPVKAGDLLGVYVVDGDGYGCLFDTADAGDVAKEVNPDHSVVGDTVTTTSDFNPTRVNVAATLVPPPVPSGPTGQRAAALKKCKKKHSKKARKKCRKRAHKLPVSFV
jgi:hypothetical protein